MTSRNRTRLGAAALAVVGLGVSSVALGLPWDTDMADGQQQKAYSFEMRQLPEGAVSQPSTSMNRFVANAVRQTPEGDALTNRLEITDQTLATGKAMYGIYCTPCHGDGVTLGPVSALFPGVAKLAGPSSLLSGFTDGYVYLTIRNGGLRMPAYGWAMSEEEMWSVVSFIRTFDNAAIKGSVPASPAPAEAP
jgi:mono/diheme cytochrome c family protein